MIRDAQRSGALIRDAGEKVAEMDAIRLENVSKSYGSVDAVKGVSLRVAAGEIFGLIGPDGAGKTTLMRAMCTLLGPDGGRILMRGADIAEHISEVRSRIGYMPQKFSLYPDLSVEQNLRFFADLFGVPAGERTRHMEELYLFSRMERFKKRKASALSGGMKQKLALSCALIHRPEILILDEPTFGVDPVSRSEFWALLRSIRAGGTTVVVSTAYMDEADMCDRVALLFAGEIIAQGTLEELKRGYQRPLYRITGRDVYALRNFFAGKTGTPGTAGEIQLFGDSIHASFETDPAPERWDAWRREAGDDRMAWERQKPGIEDVFLGLIGNGRGGNG